MQKGGFGSIGYRYDFQVRSEAVNTAREKWGEQLCESVRSESIEGIGWSTARLRSYAPHLIAPYPCVLPLPLLLLLLLLTAR